MEEGTLDEFRASWRDEIKGKYSKRDHVLHTMDTTQGQSQISVWGNVLRQGCIRSLQLSAF